MIAPSSVPGESPPRPLRPYTDTVHRFDRITIEASLLQAFTRGKTEIPLLHDVARWIFHDTIEASIAHYNVTPTLRERPLESWDALLYTLNGTHKDQRIAPLYWAMPLNPSPETLTVWARINLPTWLLVHREQHIHYDGFTRVKLRQFVDAHVVVVHKNIPYVALGVSQFPDDMSYCKRVLIATVQLKDAPRPQRDLHELARTLRCWSDERLLSMFGANADFNYHPLQALMASADTIRAHSIYCACILDLHDLSQHDDDGRHCAHVCRMAFLDLFYNAFGYHEGRMDDLLLLREHPQLWQQYYPLYTRAFTGDDLPNLFHMLWYLPLWGEVDAPEFPMAKIMLKCMPFACQRRQLLEQIEELCTHRARPAQTTTARTYCNNEGFWRVFSKIMWCCLTGAYPGSRVVPDMRKLMRVKELCDNRTLLINALTRGDAVEEANGIADASKRASELQRLKKEREDNCLVIFTAFRLYVLHMAHYNPHYADIAGIAIPWDAFREETNDMADLIRQSNLYATDVFGDARSLLARANKLKKRDVYRFRKQSLAATLLSENNEVLDKVVQRNLPACEREISVLQSMCAPTINAQQCMDMARSCPAFYDYFNDDTIDETDVVAIRSRAKEVLVLWQRLYNALEKPLNSEVRSRILVYMMRVPRHKRWTPMTLSIMRDPRYGGIELDSVCALLDLVRMYKKNALPRTIRQRFVTIAMEDIRVIAWFCSVCVSLEKISFAPLDYTTVNAIGHAMITQRYPLYPGQLLNPAVFNVLYTLCCEKLATMTGRNCFGHKDVAYDALNKIIVCNRNNTNMTTKSVEEGLDDVIEQYTRTPRSTFHALPCANQPVLTIPLRNRILIVGGQLKKKTWYMRCPRCACLHIFDAIRYQSGTYCCQHCARDDLTRPESGGTTMAYQCAYCSVGGNMGHMHGQTSRARVKPNNVLLIMDIPSAPPPSLVHRKPLPLFDMDNVFTYQRFCHRCHNIARQRNYILPRVVLWKKVEAKITEQARRAARGVYKK